MNLKGFTAGATIILFLISVANSSNSAYATHFDGIGYPYGGCGVPENLIGYPHYLALNVQRTPNDYSSYLQRPINDGSKVSTFNNGHSCGRYIRVTVGRFCEGGVNSGVPGKAWCEGGHWVADEFTGATLDYIVTDSCQDGNRWCRDDEFHTDLKTSSLPHFKKDGREVDVSQKWGNREVSWDFIKGPDTNLRFFWMANAQKYWPAMLVTGINNGISKIQENVNGQWSDAKMNSDMGQSYILSGSSGTYEVRVLDIQGNIYKNRSYKFSFPGSCPNQQCGGQPTYEVQYLNSDSLPEAQGFLRENGQDIHHDTHYHSEGQKHHHHN